MKRKKVIGLFSKFRITHQTAEYGFGWVIQKRRKYGRKWVPEFATWVTGFFTCLGSSTAQFPDEKEADVFRREIYKICKPSIHLKDMKVVPFRSSTKFGVGG